MTSGIRRCIAVSIAAVVIALPGACYAQDPMTKLGRGAANLLTGWIEVPKGVQAESSDSNWLSGITIGLAKGLGQGVVRTVAGAYEVVSFPIAAPKDYEPVLEPEYVF